MKDNQDTTEKLHFICQTYLAKKGGGLQVDKVLEYSTAAQAEERAERESRSSGCVGADAYMLREDLGSGEVSDPTFLARFGTVPEEE
ncbi:hypothetical protein [Yoonia sp. MH D7]